MKIVRSTVAAAMLTSLGLATFATPVSSATSSVQSSATATASATTATAAAPASAVTVASAKAKKAKKAKKKKKKAYISKSQIKGTWGVYKGPGEEAWKAYEQASGTKKKHLGYIANNPKPRWMGAWIGDNDIARVTKAYIENSQRGNKDAWVQMTIFRMDPWYTESQHKVPTKKQIRSYKKWIRNSAKAIGDTKTILILQPDSTFLRGVPNFKKSSGLIRYAAKRYGALPNTRVYLETGGWDWPAPGQGGAKEAARLLQASGIKYADGIATNTTHYNSTAKDIRRVAELVKIFNKRGIRGLKGVINTSSNGNGFEFGKYTGPDPDHAFACKPGKLRGTCVTLGIPPTANVSAAKWKLSKKSRRLAAKYVDGYMWIGRPWLYRQNIPFMEDRAVQLVKSSPFYKG